MPREITIEELETAMANAVDDEGNDVRLAEWVAKMTDDERRESEENLRRSLAAARTSLRKQHDPKDV